MATADFTGTNTDKIDKLVTAVVDISATLRAVRGMFLACFPLLVGLNGFMVAKIYDTGSRIDKVEARLDRLERTIDKMDDKLDRALRGKN